MDNTQGDAIWQYDFAWLISPVARLPLGRCSALAWRPWPSPWLRAVHPAPTGLLPLFRTPPMLTSAPYSDTFLGVTCDVPASKFCQPAWR